MSADLFAEFGAPSQSNHPSKSTHPAQSAPANDPFSFFDSSFSSTLPTTSSNPAQPPQSQWQTSSQWPNSQTTTRGGGSMWDDLSGLGTKKPSAAPAAAEEDDGWGDFEVASPGIVETPPKPKPVQNGFYAPSNASNQPTASGSSPRPPTRIVRASTIDMMTNRLVDTEAGSAISGVDKMQTHIEQPPSKRAEPKPKNPDPNVLFDADDFDGEAPPDEDDEFGDFETVAAPTPAAPTPMIDLISESSAPGETTGFSGRVSSTTRNAPPSQLLSSPGFSENCAFPQPQRSPSFQERNPFQGLKVTTPKQDEFGFSNGTKQQQPPAKKPEDSPTPVTAWPAPGGEEQAAKESTDIWGAFDDFTPEKKPQPETTNPGWDWDVADGVVPQSSGSAVTPFPGVSQKQQPKPAPTKKIKNVPAKQQEQKDSSWDWDAETPEQDKPTAQTNTQPQPKVVDDKAPPPTNIPPPSILLSLFPAMLALPNEALYKPTATQTPAVKARVLSDPATATFLRAYLVLATVAARILAGRKHRWHRDKFLAQSMSISAAGGKGGGMKLAGVDKTQAAREDREAADVVAVWRAHVGRLRAAVAAAAKGDDDNSNQQHFRVPEISEKPVVSTAKNVPTATKACIVCGLKRDERIKGVDFEVEDSFGEWWVDYWGHRACRNFWIEHEAELRQR
ncbi:hypothetical protein MGG_05217 [Pyricularia oryzae 70-15]|uniref:Serine/threonine-protein kinase ppk6 n=3 Tax=Pyricularia oryzae TaxID=318829 RepID=G4N546_PYRO7|nr:uncharacterized protein MGG_05217 [Pyricularia oryzae 70-15]EHA52957.1 hypothetical protein MGG_05217 [Pyricularia oryzae 70-15]ELQ39080.1 hypothetical protein OOU_Y34scaffold00516g115 [Pyricularia oryzae Y34]KAI7911805.1 hypothetical protein M9X92_010353 [Pyricularia oryzae]KAI7912820.1 hypothetical protein M0657_010289 [Pyricularia oryzae]